MCVWKCSLYPNTFAHNNVIPTLSTTLFTAVYAQKFVWSNSYDKREYGSVTWNDINNILSHADVVQSIFIHAWRITIHYSQLFAVDICKSYTRYELNI